MVNKQKQFVSVEGKKKRSFAEHRLRNQNTQTPPKDPVVCVTGIHYHLWGCESLGIQYEADSYVINS